MVEEPQKELRFTRSGQAAVFCVCGAMLMGVGVTVLAASVYRDINPELPHPAWALICSGLALVFFLLARHLTKYAYLILTPLGLEVFPFFRPARGMQLITWSEISGAEVDGGEKWLTLHFNEEKSAGIHLSLAPIRKNLRGLLAVAILGRVEKG